MNAEEAEMPNTIEHQKKHARQAVPKTAGCEKKLAPIQHYRMRQTTTQN